MYRRLLSLLLAFVLVAGMVAPGSFAFAQETEKLTIVTQPKSVAVAEGEKAIVTVGAVGDGLTYIWYFKNANQATFRKTDSFTGDTYTAPMSQVRDGRQIYCVITDKYGNSVQTDTVTLSIAEAVEITKQPTSAAVAPGEKLTVEVGAAGEGLTYKWYYKNPGTTKFKLTNTFKGNIYTISAMDEARSGRQIYCVITDKYGNSVQTDTVTLSIAEAVEITKQPQSVTVGKGETAKVTVAATGEGLTYTWYYKNAGASAFKKTDSYKGSTYVVDMSDARDGRQIYCVVTDKYGNSVKTDTVTLSMTKAVEITKQPQSVTVGKGETAKVTVAATGEGLTYTWYYKNAGASVFKKTDSYKDSTYVVDMSNARDGRQIYCVITDKYGNSVQTDTVTLSMAKTVEITKQPQSVTVGKGETAKVTVAATGEGLTYTWYYKNAGASAFKKTDTFKGNTYTVSTMDDARDGRQIYCVITDKYGNSVQTNTVTMTMKKPMSITVYTGEDEFTVVKTDTNGKYTLKTPTKSGYVFAGWETSKGGAFSSSGTIKEDVTVYAVWEIEGTFTLAQLIERINAGCDKIRIAADITVNQPLFISYDITIYSDGDYALTRDPNYAGDIFVIGQDHKGVSNLLLHRKAVLTLGGGKGTLTIDGNKSKTKVTVVGSVVFITNSGTLNLYDGVEIVNNKKLGNERTQTCSAFASAAVRQKVGGAAVLNMNGTVNMYGGVLKNNTVLTDSTASTDGSGNTVYTDISCYGGAVYNRGSFYMYGGTISGGEALSGGAIYSESYVILEAGTISGNTAAKYGGAIASSGSANCNIFIGSERGDATMTISGNTSKQAGGAIYSSTDSPIVAYGNTVFSNNTSNTNGGAIYTSGGLTIRGTTFTGNKANNGGAIFHNLSNPSLTRRDLLVGDSTFIGNTATNGGAVGLGAADSATQGTYATFQNCTFKENKASSSDGKSGNGGAIYATKMTEATFKNCTFTSNTAAGNGGAIDVSGASYVKLNGITATGNKSTVGKKGAVVYVSGAKSKVHLAGTVSVKDNVAGEEDSFVYVADATALLNTSHKAGAAWAEMTYSASAINFEKSA